jgi:hypothetical protein
VNATGGRAAIGSLRDAASVLAGERGTTVAAPSAARRAESAVAGHG